MGSEGGESAYSTFFYAKTSQKFQEKRLIAYFKEIARLACGVWSYRRFKTDKLQSPAPGNSKMVILILTL